MYRLILLLALLGVGNCWWGDDYVPDPNWPHNHWPDRDFEHVDYDWRGDGHDWSDTDHDHDDQNEDSRHDPDPEDWHLSHDRRFRKMSSYIIKADKYAQKFCTRYSNVGIQEVHGTSTYQVIYSLSECKPVNVNVKINHRILYMYARKSPSDHSDKFFDIRILPAMLKISDAAWKCEENKLTVIIPYDSDVKSKIAQEKTCLAVNEDVITVPEAPAFQYRFGN